MVRVARVDRAQEAEATHPKIPGVPPTTLLYADKCLIFTQQLALVQLHVE